MEEYILDVACGTAMATTAAFSGRDASRYRIVGLDLDARLLSLAQKKWPKLEPVCKDMMRAESEQEFDLILCVFGLHHVPDSTKPNFVVGSGSGRSRVVVSLSSRFACVLTSSFHITRR